MLFTLKDSLGRNCNMGVGKVYTYKGENGVRIKTCSNGRPKITFQICCCAVKSSEVDTKYDYITISAAIYGSTFNKRLYSIGRRLKKNDTVFFVGTVVETKAYNTNTKETIIYKECILEYLGVLKNEKDYDCASSAVYDRYADNEEDRSADTEVYIDSKRKAPQIIGNDDYLF